MESLQGVPSYAVDRFWQTLCWPTQLCARAYSRVA